MGRLYPIYMDLRGRQVVVIGGGTIAERKVQALLEAGAWIRVISPEVTESIETWARHGVLQWTSREFRSGDLKEAWLAIAACNDESVNQLASAEAQTRRTLCNVVDQPKLCSFHVPAVVRAGSLQLAISTAGTCPALAKRLCRELQEQFDETWAAYVDLMGQVRDWLKQAYPDDLTQRQTMIESVLDAGLFELLRAHDHAGVRQRLQELGGMENFVWDG